MIIFDIILPIILKSLCSRQNKFKKKKIIISTNAHYEEWFITDYECPIYGVQKMLGEYESLDKLNYLAALIDELSLSDQMCIRDRRRTRFQ